MTADTSPYKGERPSRWRLKTVELIHLHPLDPKEIVEVTRGVWSDIFASAIGRRPFRIGVDLFPKPQIMGFFLHALIPLEFAHRYPDRWRGESTAKDKDLVFIPDDRFSVEIKTSSSKGRVYGNRSYAQEAVGAKKSKSGYYLAVNFAKFGRGAEEQPQVLRIRFGWLDYEDWRGQEAPTGQQASLPPDIEAAKLVELFPEWQMEL